MIKAGGPATAILTLGLLVFWPVGRQAASYAQPALSPATAGQLIARVLQARQMPGGRGRVRLVRTDSTTRTTTTRLMTVTTRRDGPTIIALYVVTGPVSAARQALLLEVTPGRVPHGQFFESPDRAIQVTSASMDTPFFDSDLTIGDLTDDFLSWPSHRTVGEEETLRRRCAVIESRSGESGNTRHTMVRSWISPELSLPLKIEKFDAAGHVVRRIVVDRVARVDDQHWTAATLTVVGYDGQTRTKMEGIRGERNVVVPTSEFSVERIEKALRQATTPER